MKGRLILAVVAGLACSAPAWSESAPGNGVYPMSTNPWRAQQQNWYTQNADPRQRAMTPRIQADTGMNEGHRFYHRELPGMHYRERLYELREREQMLGLGNGYYGNQGGSPWWSDPVMVPYGPWQSGYGWGGPGYGRW